MTEQPNLAEVLRNWRVEPQIAAALFNVAATRPVERCSETDQQLALAAAANAYAAVYVTRTTLSIALDPADARRAHDQHGFAVEQRNQTTWYLKASADDLVDPERAAQAQVALGLAFDRSAAGPTWERGLGSRSIRHGDPCPTCGEEMPVAGGCWKCD